MAKITINGISFDPELQGTELKTLGFEEPDSSTSRYIIVQTSGPLTATQRQDLENLGATVLEYVPENAYVCAYPPADLEPVRDLEFVRWANIFLRDVKVPASLRGSGEGEEVALMHLEEVAVPVSAPAQNLVVVLHRDVDPREVADRVARAAGADPDRVEVATHAVHLAVSAQHLGSLAEIDEVRHVEEEAVFKLCNNVAVEIVKAHHVHSVDGFEGEGQVIAVCDSGFDKGSTTDVHPAFLARVKKLYAIARNMADDPDGHGTHVAGSALGDGYSSTMGGKIRGTAPKATLVLQSVAAGATLRIPRNLVKLFSTPYRDCGARVHTNSWGSQLPRQYDSRSQEVDETVWNHRDLVICFAAGNEGLDANRNGVVDAGSVISPGNAKNCITVGASESLRPGQSKPYGVWHRDFPAEPLASDLWANNPGGMAAFSGRGPVRRSGGRIKPDVVAPGTSILSAHSRNANVGDFWGSSTDGDYCFMGGTSMATPMVAGCAALVREYFIKKLGHEPSAALVKAMLINGARDIPGQYVPSECDRVPNFSEGFGRVDVARSLPFVDEGTRFEFWDEGDSLQTGEEQRFTFEPGFPRSTLKVTLVWTDPPGESLQSDLDLVVRAADGERHGNMSPESNEFDRINNVEQVIWRGVPSSTVEVVVRAYRTTAHPQSFALVVRAEADV